VGIRKAKMSEGERKIVDALAKAAKKKEEEGIEKFGDPQWG
jgi:hypothetical protein